MDTEDTGLERMRQQAAQAFIEKRAVRQRMQTVKHKILVLSSKGGVGKSTVAANLAVSLAEAGHKVGLLDIDIHGPNIPRFLDLEARQPHRGQTGVLPVSFGDSLKVMSIGFLLRSEEDPIIWRGPMKHAVIRELLADVEWGQLDYLIVDSPPGTGDEPLSIVELIDNPDGAIVVTTPQDVSLADVRKSIAFCDRVALSIIGIVENMSGFVCPECGSAIEIFGSGGGQKLAEDLGVPFLGRIPLDPDVVRWGDTGRPMVIHGNHSPASQAMRGVVEAVAEEMG